MTKVVCADSVALARSASLACAVALAADTSLAMRPHRSGSQLAPRPSENRLPVLEELDVLVPPLFLPPTPERVTPASSDSVGKNEARCSRTAARDCSTAAA